MTIYDDMAVLLTYPAGARCDQLVPICDALDAEDPALAADLRAFRNYVACAEPTALEESFTRTFDVNPVCSLELGWHLYGEDYSRGSFLVQMRELMRAVGVEETPELPDHLTHALAVLGRLEPEAATSFANAYVQPALKRMLAGFVDEESAYRTVLVALDGLFRRRFGAGFDDEPALPARESSPYDCSSGCSPAQSFQCGEQ